MKQHKPLVVMFLIFSVMLFLSSSLTVRASTSPNELVEHVKKTLDISVFHQKETDHLIKCFDVNTDGFYAIGCANNTIYIYDSTGVFQYGYRFHTEGTYGIELKENSIVIYLARSNIAVEIDPNGQCLNAEEVNIAYNILNRTKKEVGNVRYYLDRDIGIFNGNYSRLVKTEDGEEVVLYDVTTLGYFSGAFDYVILGLFPIAGIAIVIAKVKNEEKDSSPPEDR